MTLNGIIVPDPEPPLVDGDVTDELYTRCKAVADWVEEHPALWELAGGNGHHVVTALRLFCSVRGFKS